MGHNKEPGAWIPVLFGIITVIVLLPAAIGAVLGALITHKYFKGNGLVGLILSLGGAVLGIYIGIKLGYKLDLGSDSDY